MIFQNMNSLTVIRYTNKDSKHRLYVVFNPYILMFYTTFFRLSSFMKNASKIIDLITILFTSSFHTTFIFYIFHFCKVTTLYGIIRAKYKVLLLLPLSKRTNIIQNNFFENCKSQIAKILQGGRIYLTFAVFVWR